MVYAHVANKLIRKLVHQILFCLRLLRIFMIINLLNVIDAIKWLNFNVKIVKCYIVLNAMMMYIQEKDLLSIIDNFIKENLQKRLYKDWKIEPNFVWRIPKYMKVSVNVELCYAQIVLRVIDKPAKVIKQSLINNINNSCILKSF